jgi:hypothetical protein
MPTPTIIENFWEHHGLFFLIFITLFPRLTLFFSSVPFGGLLWWLGFIFAPRLLVALLATVTYLSSNPILVLISWIVALSGESSEKYYVKKKFYARRYQPAPATAIKNEAIDAEFKRLD